MTVIAFPSRTAPTSQDILALTYRLNDGAVHWRFEQCQTDDGWAFISGLQNGQDDAVSILWDAGEWVLIDRTGVDVFKSADFWEVVARLPGAMERHSARISIH